MKQFEQSQGLDAVQRWFQAVITHPDGVEGGVNSAETQQLIRLGRNELEQVIRRSERLTAEQRIGIYANAYYARLRECLRESFPVLMRALGEDVFNEFAFEYLQRFPSRSYTLGRLGDHFAEFLEQTRPDRAKRMEGSGPAWPDFLIDLARLEWLIEQVFDGPGVEKQELLKIDELRAIPRERWGEARLIAVPCLKLMKFCYPVNAYYTLARQAKADEMIAVPQPADEHVALNRRNYVVRRAELSAAQYALLEAIVAGQSIGQGIAVAAEMMQGDDERLAGLLHEWFREWTAAGFFQSVALAKGPGNRA